ncbi:hypothetical protein AVEN_241224-1 [Araneus ventricosus]|uniref:Uncharacterized protein n=1 Tax=Araneus ventricosus TaxID=182803 RepID=A0A4Y2CZI6_ARAVE|nr:hypothetical protein AVEN_241224-1 [Araneus ventricosus]
MIRKYRVAFQFRCNNIIERKSILAITGLERPRLGWQHECVDENSAFSSRALWVYNNGDVVVLATSPMTRRISFGKGWCMGGDGNFVTGQSNRTVICDNPIIQSTRKIRQ